jgi:dipeptidase D
MQMTDLEPKSFWRYFVEICSIPHPSGHEAALAKRIVELAAEHGLKSRIDAAGNVRIDRPAETGFEKCSRTIMQAHLDMVPQSVPGLNFDFTSMPITPIIRDGWIVTEGTTLGADDGAGLALALSMLFDKSLKTGPLAGVFTVSEETGLVGAQKIEPAFLDGDNLLNLDGGSENLFCIGCAGGCRLEIVFTTDPEPAVEGSGVEISLTGLRGGHSGKNINDRRGNALIYLCRFLSSEPYIRIGSIDGGSVENAIPRDAVARGVSGETAEALQKRATLFAVELAKEFDAPEDFKIYVAAIKRPESLWSKGFQKKLINAVVTAPNGVMAFSEEFNCVRTSSNLAAIHSNGERLLISTSQRSMDDSGRELLTERIAAHFAAIGGTARKGNCYPGWSPQADSVLLKTALELKKKLTGIDAEFYVTHAGLEAGIFHHINPDLDIISFTPTSEDIHSPGERLEIGSVERVHRFIRELLEQIG